MTAGTGRAVEARIDPGDHVLGRTTPHQFPQAITPFGGLEHYFHSLAKVRRLFPGLGQAHLERIWAGLRPAAPDGLPILGWLPGLPALVATGRADVMVDPRMNPWDCAALIPVLQEAGGHFLDWTGKPTIHGGNGIGVNAALKDGVLQLLGG